MICHETIYVNGDWVPSDSTGAIEVVSAITEEVMGQVPAGCAADVDAAVAAAKAAFPAWAATPAKERQALIYKLVDELKARADKFLSLISQEVGQPVSAAQRSQVKGPMMNMQNYGDLLNSFEFEDPIGANKVLREPVGVVGCITPWNYPLNMIVSKTGAAFASGCTVVLKPSEVAPLNAYVFADAVQAAGFPPGVFNLIMGDGPTVGAALTAHPDVDKISFTGSTRAGKIVGATAMETIKQVGLELGGKSAFIVLDDADFDEAIPYGVNDSFKNSGQTCVSLTRMLVPESRYEEAVAKIEDVVDGITLGDPREEGSHLGPVISQQQWDTIQRYIKVATQEGAKLVRGGPDKPEDQQKGYFVKPTVFADVTPDMTIAQEEVFGPVLSVMTYRDEDHAIEIANGTSYGLSGGVWSGSVERAEKVAAKMRTGSVLINGGRFSYELPLSGYKQSGVGRENGKYGLEEFLLTKALSYG